MTDYNAPTRDMRFILEHVLPQDNGVDTPDAELMTAILDEAAKLARDVIAPLNSTGDKQGCQLSNGNVKTADGFQDAYARYRDNGWNSVPFDEEIGGQGLPWSLAYAVQEMWQSACMSFGLCPMLNQSAVEALETHGSDDQKATYLSKMVTGEWTGTMNLTEPQAGSDLSAVKTKAVRQEDGSYKITGQKIYITYGEHDLAENIIHMILARTSGAPDGVKGLSLFLVPKFIPDDKGTFSQQNDLVCSGIEHKLGIHASPTCTMQFGDRGGATGWLVGEEYDGLKLMFTMMNNARLAVGLQGVAISERACQQALSFANDRVQGRPLSDQDGKGTERVSIIHHPDIRRMLMEMQSRIQAGRALAYEAAAAMDQARNGDLAASAYMDLLTPVVKAWCTDNALSVTSMAIQIHGGMGFIEETGIAQHYRDARILSIYEGTNGIQANDLVFRKIIRDEGKAFNTMLESMRQTCRKLKNNDQDLGQVFEDSLNDLDKAARTLFKLSVDKKTEEIAALSYPFLTLLGDIAGGYMMARSYLAASRLNKSAAGNDFYDFKMAGARFYLLNILVLSKGYADRIRATGCGLPGRAAFQKTF